MTEVAFLEKDLATNYAF